MNEASQIRELFIDELEQVTGGNPVKELIQQIRDGWNTTHACCEEGPDGCCSGPVVIEPV